MLGAEHPQRLVFGVDLLDKLGQQGAVRPDFELAVGFIGRDTGRPRPVEGVRVELLGAGAAQGIGQHELHPEDPPLL